MSPPLVVAFALAGRVDIDFVKEPICLGKNGKEIFLKDIWPSLSEIRDALRSALTPEMFTNLYGNFAGQNPKWNEISAPTGEIYEWDTKSTYIQEPPFFENFGMEAGTITPISGARALGIFGDSVTTDHISPAGAIKEKSPAGRFLSEHGVTHEDFNSYGSRRGNDRIMTRGTFANVRIKNLMLPGVEGGETLHQPDGERMSIFDASHKYQAEKTPLIIVAGQEYGTGSSRDWAAKGTRLLGVKAVIAASYERIHRSNLVGMGILPLQFMEGTNAQSLSLDGTETYDIIGLSDNLEARQDLAVRITRKDGSTQEVPVKVRIDTPIEVDYYRHGGILPFILRQLINEAK
jgi:aconitate hydratase